MRRGRKRAPLRISNIAQSLRRYIKKRALPAGRRPFRLIKLFVLIILQALLEAANLKIDIYDHT